MTAMPFFVDLGVVAEILDDLGNEIEQVGVTLCLDPAVSTDHIKILQSIDLIAQTQKGLATFLKSDCPVTASESITLDCLRKKLGLI